MIAPFDSKVSATAVTDLGSSGAGRVEQGFPDGSCEVLGDRRYSNRARRTRRREICGQGNCSQLIAATAIVTAFMNLVVAHVEVGFTRRYAVRGGRRINRRAHVGRASGAHR